MEIKNGDSGRYLYGERYRQQDGDPREVRFTVDHVCGGDLPIFKCAENCPYLYVTWSNPADAIFGRAIDRQYVKMEQPA